MQKELTKTPNPPSPAPAGSAPEKCTIAELRFILTNTRFMGREKRQHYERELAQQLRLEDDSMTPNDRGQARRDNPNV